MRKKRSWCYSALLILLTTTVVYAAKPADAMIDSARQDLSRYEAQADQLQIGNRSGALRIVRFLPLIEGRLASSEHKDDASWKEAQHRLDALKSRLEMIQTGKTAVVTSSSQQKPQAPQTHATPQTSDPVLKTVLQDLQQYEHQAAILQAGEKSATSHIKRSLTITESRLGSSKDQSTLAWKEARQRLDALKTRLDDISSGSTAPSSDSDKSRLERFNALQAAFFNELNRLTPEALDDPSVYASFDTKIVSMRSLVAGLTTPAYASSKQKAEQVITKAQSYLKQKSQPDDAATHRQFTNAYQNVRVALESLKAGELAKPDEARYWRQKVATFDAIVARFSDKDAPDVKKDLLTYTQMKTKLEGFFTQAQNADLVNFPDYKKDLASLKELAEKYKYSALFIKGSEQRAKALLDAFDADKKLFASLYKRYDPFMKINITANDASIEEANMLRKWFGDCQQNMNYFTKNKKEFFDTVFPTLDNYIAEAEKMIKEAVGSKNMNGFSGGGIQQRVDRSENILLVYRTLLGSDDVGYRKYRSRLDTLAKKIAQTEITLAKSIISSRKMPVDAYSKSDKKALMALPLESFKKAFPEKKVLAYGFYDSEWERKTSWEWTQSAWAKSDFSQIQVWVIAKKDAQTASLYSSNIFKNHMKDDALTSHGFSTKDLGRDILLKNVKQ